MEEPVFIEYRPSLRATCLALFDANCPAYFAPNERADFAQFLNEIGPDYAVLLQDGKAKAAFSLTPTTPGHARLNWIMVAPESHGAGIGRLLMQEAKRRAKALGAARVEIAASHLSAPFFSRFGARECGRTAHGWGPDMHRVDMEWVLTA